MYEYGGRTEAPNTFTPDSGSKGLITNTDSNLVRHVAALKTGPLCCKLSWQDKVPSQSVLQLA